MDAGYLSPEQRYLSLDSCVEMKQLIEVTPVSSSSSSSSTAALCYSGLLVVVVVVVAILLNTRNTRHMISMRISSIIEDLSMLVESILVDWLDS